MLVRNSQSLLKRYGLAASEIEPRSFQIVRGLLPLLSVSPAEMEVVVRIVHTCGDPGVAGLAVFHPRCVDAATQALRKGTTVFTDVRMVAAGIKGKLAGSLGCPVRCALDTTVTVGEGNRYLTRTALAMQALGRQLDGSIVAIGNAPTALLALLDMIDEGLVAPAVIIGMPVGFVAAAEAKRELARRDTPFMTIQGTRGGSAMAAATVNALMLLARDAQREVMPEAT